MSQLKWDVTGERTYETGVKKCVLYPQSTSGTYPVGYAWSGITSVAENPSGGEPSPIYADDIKFLNLIGVEELGGSIEAYMYPNEFAECDGSANIVTGVSIGQQKRKSFGLCYRTILGNDTEQEDYAYKLHLIYGCLAKPSARTYSSVNGSPEPNAFSWEYSTTPVEVSGKKPTANITIDTSLLSVSDKPKLKALENILYGVDADEFSQTKTYAVGDHVTHEDDLYVCVTAVSTAGAWNASNWSEVTNPGPRLPLPDEIATIFA